MKQISILLNNRRWQIVFIAILIAFTYLRTLSYDFIELDENSLLLQKKEFNQHLSNIPAAFTQHVFQTEGYVGSPGSLKFYRPLLTVSFILDAQLAGDKFQAFHFSNIFYHFIAVLGLLFVLYQLKVSPPLSFLTALLFAVHPLITQAIAWIPGRNDSIASGFILWSLFFLLRYIQSPNFKDITFHLLLFAGALFTKENTVVFPIICLFLLFFKEQRSLSVRNKIILSASYMLIALLWLFARNAAVGSISNTQSLSELYYTFLKNFPLALQYIQKTFIPVNLAVMASVLDTNYVWVLCSLLLLGSGIYYSKKIPWLDILFGGLWFFLFLLPTQLFSYFEGMEHRSYLPIIGLLFATVQLEPIQKLNKTIYRLLFIFGTMILVFISITITRLPVFSSELNYWKNAYETSAHSDVVCRDYGVTLTKMGDYPAAEKVFLEGLKRNPDKTLIHYNLGVMYYHTNRLDEAKEQLNAEMKINRENFMLFHLMGEIYKQENDIKKAVAMWEESARLNPKFTESYKELLTVYSRSNDSLNFNRCKAMIEKNGFKITDKRSKK